MGAAEQYDEGALRSAGFSDDEIAQDKAQTAAKLSQAGFSGQEVSNYFTPPGAQNPDNGAMKAYVQKNLESLRQSNAGEIDSAGSQPAATPGAPKQATDFGSAFMAGLQISSGGLYARSRMPDVVLPEHADMAMRIGSQIGSLAGDMPAMVAGGVFGGAMGSEVPGVGTALGGAAGAMALPAALRTAYMQDLQQGKVSSFGDFWARTAATTWEAMKAGTVGAATAGIGGPVAAAMAKAGASPLAQGAGSLASQIATMTTIGKGLENQAPSAQDFLDGAIMVGGLHAFTSAFSEPAVKNISTKLQDVYAQTGMTPAEVGTKAMSDPVLKQELVSSDPDFPKSLEPLRETPQPNQEALAGAPFPKTQADAPKSFAAPISGINPEFTSGDAMKVDAPPPKEAPLAAAPESSASGQEPPGEPTAREQIAARIGDPTEPERPGLSWSDTYRSVMDRLDPINKLVDALNGERPLKASVNPYELELSLNGRATGLSRDMMENGPRDFFTQARTGTPGFQEIFKPFKDDLDGFMIYGVAQHAIELEREGISSGVPLDAAKQYVSETKGKYEQGLEHLVHFQNDILKYMSDSGVVSRAVYEKSVDKWDYYLPFFRIMEDGEEGLKGRYGPGSAVKAIRGSEKLLAPPAESLIRNTYAYVKLAEKYRGRTELIRLAGPDNPLVSKVTPPAVPINVSSAEIKGFMETNELSGNPEDFTIFRRMAEPLQPGEIDVMKDGKRDVYQIGEVAAKAFQANGWQPSPVVKTLLSPMSWIAKLQRMGITEDPAFLLKHGIRAEAMAFIQSNNGYVPVYDALRGAASYFREPELWHDFLSSGGAQSTLASMDRDYIKEDISKLTQETGLTNQMQNVIENPLQAIPVTMKLMAQAMRGVSDAVMNAPKFGEFIRAREAGKDLFTAGSEAADVTTNYYKVPDEALFQAWNQYTPFFQMRLRGMDKLYRSFQDDPVRTGQKMAVITGLSLATWWAFKDDDRYKKAERYEKDLAWIIPLPGVTLRIPKPFEAGLLFGSAFERIMDKFYTHNPEAFKGFGEALLGNTLPNLLPAALTPVAEQWANKQWLSGNKIVPDSVSGVAPAYKYTPYTTETAKALGKMISYLPGTTNLKSEAPTAAPAVIDNYVRQWGGTLGQYAFQLSDKALAGVGYTHPAPAPSPTWSDIPFIKSFVVRYPSANAQPVQDFFDNFKEVQTMQNTQRDLMKGRDFTEAQSFIHSPQAMESMIPLQGFEKAISTQLKTIKNVYADPTMKPYEKRQLIDGLYYMVINEASRGNNLFEQFKKQTTGVGR